MSVLVVGSGIIGLTTAHLLSQSGKKVLIRSMAPLSSTCSQGAGGLWMPFHCDDVNTNRWARTTLLKYLSLAETPEEPLGKHVEIVQTTVYKNLTQFSKNDTDSYTNPTSSHPPWATENPELVFQAINMSQLEWQGSLSSMHIPDTMKDNYSDAWTFKAPIIDSLKYMEDLKGMCLEGGVDIKEDVEVSVCCCEAIKKS
jgi:D-amino-acid oxidase